MRTWFQYVLWMLRILLDILWPRLVKYWRKGHTDICQWSTSLLRLLYFKAKAHAYVLCWIGDLIDLRIWSWHCSKSVIMQIKSSQFCYNLHVPKSCLILILSFSSMTAEREFIKSLVTSTCLATSLNCSVLSTELGALCWHLCTQRNSCLHC